MYFVFHLEEPDGDLIGQAAEDNLSSKGAETIQKSKENNEKEKRNSNKQSPTEKEKEYNDDNYSIDEQIQNDFEGDQDYDPYSAESVHRTSETIAGKGQYASLITQQNASTLIIYHPFEK